MQTMKIVSVLFSLLVLHGSVASAGPDPTDRCVAAKINATGQRFAAISNCRAKAVLAGTAVDPRCLDKAEKQFLAAFAKAESHGACTVTGDAAVIDGKVGACAETVDDETARRCGDGIIAPSEACDDGNAASGDGCSSTCRIETGFQCTGAPSVCTSTCGDGILASNEACDDGNRVDGDGCSASCAIESGYSCAGSPSVCTTICGDGLIRGAETCDDGGTSPRDGCSATCSVEGGWDCSGEPSVCTCVIVPVLFPASRGIFVVSAEDFPFDASSSYSGCGLPLQYFWDCPTDLDANIACPDPNFVAEANSNGNTNATPTIHLEPVDFETFDISLTVCFAGTSNCAPPIVYTYQVTDQ